MAASGGADGRRANSSFVLLALGVVAVLFPLGFIAVVGICHAAMKRLALEPWSVLLWFGLAEDPVDELAQRRAAPVRPRLRALSGSS